MKTSSNSWESFRNFYNKADKAIQDILQGEPMGVWLDKVIHELIWHDGVCVVRWIDENKELVSKISKIANGEDFEKLLPEIRLSVMRLSKNNNG